MFHHFCDSIHPRGQGAISADDLARMIRFLGRERILDAPQWMERALDGRLGDDDVCLTFDDALRCQYDIAAPVLADFGISGFWFVYSSVFQGGIEPLEVYRYFRTVAFADIDAFYEAFFRRAADVLCEDERAAISKFDPERYLPDDPFYTRNDRIFRYLRDDVLGPVRYRSVMNAMIADEGFDIEAIKDRLWITDDHLRALDSAGHVVGLHSFRHPTRLAALPADRQRDEYRRNRDHIMCVLGREPVAMSHPCNSYTAETLDILQDLGIRIGFRAYVDAVGGRSPLEFPREDHALVMARMNA